MNRTFLTGLIAAGMMVMTTPVMAQWSGKAGVQTPGFNGNAAAKGKRSGPNDGTGNQGQRPRDGSGNGAKSGKGGGSGACDGAGPQGKTQGGRGSKGGGRR